MKRQAFVGLWLRHVAVLLTLGIGMAVAPVRADEASAFAAGAATNATYSSRTFDWFDAARNRAVPVRLYLPDASSAERPVPLVVFSHGIGGSRDGYSYLGRYWASQGYASLHVQHVGSDRGVWAGNPLEMLGRLREATQEGEALHRVRDLRFAIDQLLADGLAPRIDAQRVVAAGHSYGANTVLLAAGANVLRDGRSVALRDARIKAAIILSAPPFYGETQPQRILGAIDVPSLHVTATEDIIRVPGHYSGADDRVAVYEATGGPRKTLAVFEGGSHSMFTDRAGSGGYALNAQVKQATRELTLAFLNSVFSGDESALDAWPGHFAGIVARYAHDSPVRPP